MRKFERISFDEFKKDISESKELYNSIELPKRSTINSAGYDIRSIEDAVIKPGESRVIKTGIKACMNSDEVLYLYIRSSLGFKYDICLSNNVGVIDSDYYNNPGNEGHIQIKLINHGKSDFEIKRGDRIAQGVFMKYLCIDDEKVINNKRIGGTGSTNEEEK